ncbi:MAG: peptidoglycan DD-metalloendopeptidase family protein [Schleiferiaceae bacterium]|nr:peptidoglycan DD-metalloendopeptidase family protein [Schleiferiaceae bacterium]
MDKFKYLFIPLLSFGWGDWFADASESSNSNSPDSASVMEYVIEEEIDRDNLWLLDTSAHFQFLWDTENCHVDSIDLSKIDTTIWLCVVNDYQRDYAIPTPGEVRSPFAFRRNRFHYGVDLPLRTGDTVYAAFDGKVRYAQRNFGGYGNMVVIRHHNELETYYAHFSQILVAPNQMVKAGEPIGLGGSTGRSTGPHLHFEVRYLGNAIDPELVFDFSNETLKDENLLISPELFEHKKKMREAKYYKVRSGDTLYSIAKRHGTTVNKLCQINGIRSNSVIRAGQTLRVN